MSILSAIGVSATGYTYQEKKNHHKPSHHIRVPRSADVIIMGRALLPYSVTKRRMWLLAIELSEIKVSRRRIMPDGRLSRGGIPNSPVTEREFELVRMLREINYREKPEGAL